VYCNIQELVVDLPPNYYTIGYYVQLSCHKLKGGGLWPEAVYIRADHRGVEGCLGRRQRPGRLPEHGISDATCYKWRTKYAGLEVSDVKKLRQLEEENRR
jgi:hypothetical protein